MIFLWIFLFVDTLSIIINDRWIIIFKHNIKCSDTHYKWLQTHDHQLHSKWSNYHGFEGYVISGPNTTIESIRNHDMVHFIQKENIFSASLNASLNLKPAYKKVKMHLILVCFNAWLKK